MQVLRRVLPCSVLALLFLGAGPTPLLLGQTASLVADLQTGPDAFSPIPHDVGTFGENALFQAFGPSSSSQMWVSDGTGSGTRPIQDAGEHRALFLGTIGRVVFWRSGLDLWRSDGTQDGTFRLSGPGALQFDAGFDATRPLFAFTKEFLYFAGCTDDLGCEIWRTDGTQEGTRIVQDLAPGRDNSSIQEFGAAGDLVFVLVANELRGVEPNSTRLILTLQDGEGDLWAAARGRLFFLAGRSVWATDGTQAGTRRLMESSVSDSSWPLTAASSGLYFMASESGRAWEIWKSDGTPGGTRRISELPRHVGVFEPYGLHYAAEIGGSLLFLAYGDSFNRRLWRLSIQSGTVAPVGEGAVRSELFQVGGRVLFALRSGEGCDVWSIDAAQKITRLVTGLSCGTFAPENLVPYVISGDHFYFSGFTSSALQIWKSNGTTAGTDLLFSVRNSGAFRDIAVSATGRRVFVTLDAGLWLWEQPSGARQLMGSGPRTGSADLSDLLSIGSRLFFSVCTTERNLWTSTGTAAGTEPLTSFSGEFCHGDLAPVAAGTSLFFLDPTHHELWKTDSAGNAPVLLIRDLGQMSHLTAHQGLAWFVVRAGAHSEIWRSDGTPAGTRAVAPLPGDMQIMAPLFSTGELLYFTAGSSGSGGSNLMEVWRSDGTAAGTVRLAGTDGHFARDFVRLGPFVYFLSDGLWRTDGTPAGTVPLSGAEVDFPSGLVEHAGSLYLFGRRSLLDPRLTLWRTNGAPEDTIPVATFPLELYSNQVRPTLVPFHGRLFFAVDDGIYGTELWVSDGTSAGTALVSDLASGPASSSPELLTVAGDALYFSAHDGAHGKELWRTDGTAAGTRRVQDIAPESLSSSPEHLTVAGDHLYFTADDGLTGRELWKLPLTGPVCQPSSTRLCLNGGRFQIEAVWRDFQGRIGRGMASSLTGDTGYFWFFDPANAEVVLKVLDGRGLNDHFWIFYGALSNVEYAVTVTDTQTGLARRYLNPSGQLASVGDTQGFGPLGAHSATPEPLVALPSPPALVSDRTVPAAATGTCQPGPRRLCLNGGRFAVEASWKDFQGNTGKGTAVSLTGDTGWFWFFDPSNVEVMLKVLDGTPLNGKFWVFYGALSNVEYTLTVTDTQTGAVKEYRNPSGRFASVADTGAFSEVP